MAKTTTLYFEGFSEDNLCIFRANRGYPLVIKSCDKGNVTLFIPSGTSIRYLSEILEGCFNEKSNFVKQVSNFYDCPKLEQVNFVFNGIDMTVTKENANKVFHIWQEKFKVKRNKETISKTS